NFKIKNIEDKSNQSNNQKAIDTDTFQSTDEQEKIIDKELINPKDLSKENSSNKKEKENDNDNLNQSNSKEKNIITVDLTNEEKIVFSQLGINPLIKLGKEYLTSNNFVRLKESNKETEKPSDNKKTKAKQIKKISKSGEDKIQIKIEANANSKDKSTNKTNENNEVVFTDKKDEIEITDELNNARKKRRRSSASIE
ncbi:ribonuclease E/G, partial [Prochlorococcus sp. AH-716-J09]|nr:ribonuclease E/G [Prochlorococcus sp. AH-716-J09]